MTFSFALILDLNIPIEHVLGDKNGFSFYVVIIQDAFNCLLKTNSDFAFCYQQTKVFIIIRK